MTDGSMVAMHVPESGRPTLRQLNDTAKPNRLSPVYKVFQQAAPSKKKAVLLGVDYFGQRGQLGGCAENCKRWAMLLEGKWRFSTRVMIILTETQRLPVSQPTRQNVMGAINWLVRDHQPGDTLVFFYNGHGDGPDTEEESIYPMDFRENGQITHDELHRSLVGQLASGTRLIMIIDSYYSSYDQVWLTGVHKRMTQVPNARTIRN